MGKWNKILSELQRQIDSGEVKKYFEKKESEKIREKQQQTNFHNLTKKQKDSFIEKVYIKYNSDEYIKNEYSLGFQPRTPLNFFLYGYAKNFCKEYKDVKLNNMFVGEMYKLNEYFIIRIMHGQGSVVDIIKIK